jgi:hypothetical protein
MKDLDAHDVEGFARADSRSPFLCRAVGGYRAGRIVLEIATRIRRKGLNEKRGGYGAQIISAAGRRAAAVVMGGAMNDRGSRRLVPGDGGLRVLHKCRWSQNAAAARIRGVTDTELFVIARVLGVKVDELFPSRLGLRLKSGEFAKDE